MMKTRTFDRDKVSKTSPDNTPCSSHGNCELYAFVLAQFKHYTLLEIRREHRARYSWFEARCTSRYEMLGV